MKVLVLTQLYPHSGDPGRCAYTRQLVRALRCRIDLRVIAPVPFFPAVPGFGRWSRFGAAARHWAVDGMPSEHPRFPVVPRVEWATGSLYRFAVSPAVGRLFQKWPFDLIHAHWLYPDGFAAAAIGRRLGRPVVLSVHGSDGNEIAWRPAIRPLARRALAGAARVIPVSAPLAERLVALGASPDAVEIIPCAGFDPARFQSQPQAAARQALGLAAGDRIVLFVGELVAVKRVDLLLHAIARVRAVSSVAPTAVIVGDGPERARLQQLARDLGIAPAVRFAGLRPHAEVPIWLAAADVLCLPSRSEGTPNAVVEALAAGRPVVATAVGGVPALVREPLAGILVPPADASALAEALRRALGRQWDGAAIRASVADYTWDRLASRYVAVFERVRAAGEASDRPAPAVVPARQPRKREPAACRTGSGEPALNRVRDDGRGLPGREAAGPEGSGGADAIASGGRR